MKNTRQFLHYKGLIIFETSADHWAIKGDWCAHPILEVIVKRADQLLNSGHQISPNKSILFNR